MYGKEFWKRTRINHILEFIQTGGELLCEDAKKGTPEERHAHYTTSLFHGMALTRDRITTFDWNNLGDDEAKKADITYEMFEEIMNASYELSDLAFEMGLISGLNICFEINQSTIVKPLKQQGE